MRFHELRDVPRRGRIEQITYTTTTAEGALYEKYANIYLPYGYSAERKYNVLYLIHGGGGHADAWLDCCKIKNLLDVAFIDEYADPCIVVFPTYYNTDDPQAVHAKGFAMQWEADQTVFFQKELRKELISAVETRYSTWLVEDSEEGKKATRWHRAIGGFSMGGGTTWNAFLENMDVFGNFMPISGDCWHFEIRGGEVCTEKTAAYIVENTKAHGFGKDDFRVFAATGTKDIAYPALVPMVNELKKYTELFEFSEDLESGNLHLVLVEDAPHTYDDIYHHVYNFLPVIFPEK